jgi:Protein of unknown function (DUF1778)
MTNTNDTKRTIIRLSAEDQRAFAEAILNPPEPTPALRRATRRYRELIQEPRGVRSPVRDVALFTGDGDD